MHAHRSLLSRMKDLEPQDPVMQPQPQDLHPRPQPQDLHPQLTLLNRMSHRVRTPRLLDRMNSPPLLQELPLDQAHGVIRTYSSTVIPSSKDIVRGRSPKRRHMSTSSLNSSELSEMTGPDLMQPSDLSSRLSKATTLKSKQPRKEGVPLRSKRCSAPPALLYRFQMGMDQMENQCQRESGLTNQSMPGSLERKINVPSCETVSQKPSGLSKPTQSTLKQPNVRSSTNLIVPSSRTQSGRTSSPEELSTSMQCSVDSYPLLRMTPKSKSLGTSKSPSELLNPLKLSRTVETGQSPGTGRSERLSLPSHTEYLNSQAMESTSSTSSPSLTPVSIAESLPLIEQSVNESAVLETLNSPILKNSPISRSRTWIRSGYRSSQMRQKTEEIRKARRGRTGKRTNLVINGTMASVAKRKEIAEDCMSAINVEKEDTRERSVERLELLPKRPKYLERSVWTDVKTAPIFSPTACCTLIDDPLPRPPAEEYDNHAAISTIQEYPHLFQIVSPIKVDRFEELLSTHPNQAFVQSVCTSFREGFWPWAKTQGEEYPVTWDYSNRPPKTEREADFLRNQRDIELAENRYSEGFGTDLLPGMYSTPVHAVPKPRSQKLRLVNDHSAGTYSLNSMIARGDVVGAKMDSISDLIGALLRYRKKHPKTTLILFKSDVSAAYRRLPLHPLWQVKQIVTIDGVRHVDRCTCFGGRGSCRDYTAFMGLVLWIAIFVKLLADLFGYIDDNFSFDEEGNVTWYDPYQCYFPAKQTGLLKLWDEIGLPHDKSKQEYAPVLRIIGFMVDPNLMRVSMDEEDRTRLVKQVLDFSATAPGGTRRTLREFQQLAGWINWSFNVFPLLKPALSNIYAKMGGKTESHAKVFVSKAVVQDLEWFIFHVRGSDGVYLFEDVDWDVRCADVTAYSDACMSGLGFFFERSQEGFQCKVPQDPPKGTIFYFEALAVVSVVEAATQLPTIPSRLLIFSDSSNTVDIFHSLRSLPPYNGLLKYTVSLLIKHNISLRVVHIPGVDNIIADSLSRFENTKAIASCPGLSISSFQPPRLALGSAL